MCMGEIIVHSLLRCVSDQEPRPSCLDPWIRQSDCQGVSETCIVLATCLGTGGTRSRSLYQRAQKVLAKLSHCATFGAAGSA